MPSLSADARSRALSLRDLTDPAQGPHAMQLVLRAVVTALQGLWRCDVLEHRASPVVSVHDNYDALGYPPDGAARDARYTRYLSDDTLLRTQTSAMVPPLLRTLEASPPRDVLLVCPGLVYRRDAIDRLHSGEPHQVDLWRVVDHPLEPSALETLVAAVVDAALPGWRWRTTPTSHPYTEGGLQLDVRDGEAWVEVGECGYASPALLRRCGLPRAQGLAMGLGLDRLLMLRKGVTDIRLLRSGDPRVARQWLDLKPWRAVSRMPAVQRDLSLAVDPDDDVSDEVLGDRVREALGPRAVLVEEVRVLAVTPGGELPHVAAQRLGLLPGQRNVLLRVVLRALDRSLCAEEGNALRDDVYAALHRGRRWTWAGSPRVVDETR